MQENSSCLQNIKGILYFSKDTNLRYITANNILIQLLGVDSAKHIVGCYDKDLPACIHFNEDELSAFQREDHLALQGNTVLSVDMHNYLGSVKTFLVKKAPLFETTKKIAGIHVFARELKNPTLTELNLLLRAQHLSISKGVKDNIENFFSGNDKQVISLSKQELQVLYYIGRSKSTRQISDALNLPKRNISIEIEKLKAKLNCHYKSELTELSIDKGIVLFHQENVQHIYFIEI